MWLHRVPRSERFLLATAPFAFQPLQQGDDGYSSSVPVFLIDAANSSVLSVLQHRMGFPGVGSWDHVTVHVPSFCSLDSFRFHPLNCCCFTTSTLLLPATPPIRLCAEANPEGRRSYTKPLCQPLYYRPGLLRHGGYASAVPDLWDLSACL